MRAGRMTFDATGRFWIESDQRKNAARKNGRLSTLTTACDETLQCRMPMRDERSIEKRAVRLAQLKELLRLKTRTVAELEAILSVPRRTVQRDLEDLGIRSDHKRPPKYALPTPPPTLDASEVLVAHTALRLLYHHSPDRPRSFQRALEKLSQNLPESLRPIVQNSINLDTIPDSQPHERTLEIITEAWTHRHVIGFDYVKRGGSGETRYNEVEPYFLEIGRSNLELYLIGQRRNWQPAVRTFRLNLIKNIMPHKNHTYDIPEAFNPRLYLSNAWGVIGDANPITVKVKIDASVAPWLEQRRFPGAQAPEKLADGGLIYTIRTGADGDGMPRELIPWIRGWGANIEVLEPPMLREKWLADARDLIARHGME